jgi:hypothetical protein
MKLSITQVVFGVLIILAACYITGWTIYKAPGQLTQPVTGDAGKTIYIDVIPENEAMFNIASYGSWLLPVIGIFLVIAGTAQAARGGVSTRGLTIGVVIAGVIVAALGFIITTWGYPTTFMSAHPDENNRLMMVFSNPGRSLVFIQSVSGCLLLPGVAAAGIGVAQLVKSRIKSSI